MAKIVIISLQDAYLTLQSMVPIKDHGLYEAFLLTVVYEVLFDSIADEEEIDSILFQLGVSPDVVVDVHSIIYNIVYHILIPYREILPVDHIEQIDFEDGHSYRLLFTTI